jgi:hypothetical protein
VAPARTEAALAIFDWTRIAAEIWRGSSHRVRREVLDVVCLNRTLSDVNLDATKRKPFDVFAKGLEIDNSRGDRTSIELFRGGGTELVVQISLAVKALTARLASLVRETLPED